MHRPFQLINKINGHVGLSSNRLPVVGAPQACAGKVLEAEIHSHVAKNCLNLHPRGLEEEAAVVLVGVVADMTMSDMIKGHRSSLSMMNNPNSFPAYLNAIGQQQQQHKQHI